MQCFTKLVTVNHNTLKAICFAIFESQINYASIMWGKGLEE